MTGAMSLVSDTEEVEVVNGSNSSNSWEFGADPESNSTAVESQVGQPIRRRGKKYRRSELWSFFTPIKDGCAVCNLCQQSVSYKTSITNLRSHLSRRHSLTTSSLFRKSQSDEVRMEIINNQNESFYEFGGDANNTRSRCLEDPIKKLTSADVWSFYKPVETGFAICSFCDITISHGRSISNLKGHLSRKHREEIILQGKLNNDHTARDCGGDAVFEESVNGLQSNDRKLENHHLEEKQETVELDLDGRNLEVWDYFQPLNDGYATCNICDVSIAYEKTEANLMKHLMTVHPDLMTANDSSDQLSEDDMNITDVGSVSPDVNEFDSHSATETSDLLLDNYSLSSSGDKRKRVKRSSFWNFFVSVDEENAICKLCNKKFCHKASTGNLKKHLNRNHLSEILLMEETQNDDFAADDDDVGNDSCASFDWDVPPTSEESFVNTQVNEEENDELKPKRRSPLWNFFLPIDKKCAICKMCNKIFSFKTSTGNLRKHLMRTHRTEMISKPNSVSFLINELQSDVDMMDDSEKNNSMHCEVKTTSKPSSIKLDSDEFERKIEKPNNSRSKTSKVWNYFTVLDSKFATCNICSRKISYKTSLRNLRRHLSRNHDIKHSALTNDVSKHSAALINDVSNDIAKTKNCEMITEKHEKNECLTSDESDIDAMSDEFGCDSQEFAEKVKEQKLISRGTEMWSYFDRVDNEYVTCSLCNTTILCETSIANLKKHLRSHAENDFSFPHTLHSWLVKGFKSKEQMALEVALNKPPGSYSADADLASRKEDRHSHSKIVSAANKIFGFNGWSYSVTEQTVDFIDLEDSKYEVGVSALVKVQLRDGTFHEDIGYGFSKGLSSKGESLAKARRMASHDALRNALGTFGTGLRASLEQGDEAPNHSDLDNQQEGSSYSVLTSVKRRLDYNNGENRSKKKRKESTEVHSNSSSSESICLETTCNLLQQAAPSLQPDSSQALFGPLNASTQPSTSLGVVPIIKQEKDSDGEDEASTVVGLSTQNLTLSPIRSPDDENRVRRKIRQYDLEIESRQKAKDQLMTNLSKYLNHE